MPTSVIFILSLVLILVCVLLLIANVLKFVFLKVLK